MSNAHGHLAVLNEPDQSNASIGCKKVAICCAGVSASPGAESPGSMMAFIGLDTDVSDLFPYINAEIEHARLSDNPQLIRFVYQNHRCVLYPDSCLTTPFYERSQAHRFKDRLMEFLNDIQRRKDKIIPKYKLFKPTSVVEILKLLPKNNCRKCGFNSCMAFAARLSQQEVNPDLCPYLGFPLAEQAIYPVYDNDGNLKSTVTIGIGSERKHQNNDGPVGALKSNLKNPLSIVRKKMETDGNKALPTPLTGREIEVLEMIVQGATNPEIADCLYISPHTVKSHVIHIFNKLGVDDRTQAAVWAIRHSLV